MELSLLRKGVLFFALLGLSQWSSGQNTLGINADNYAPVNTMSINPSTIVDQGPWIDINIVGLSAYTRTNFLYFRDAVLTDPNSFEEYVIEEPGQDLYGINEVNVLGPSMSIVFKDHSFAFHTAARSYTFMKNLPSEAAGFVEDSLDLVVADGIYGAELIRIKELTWEEYGLTYGRILHKRNKNMWTGALNLNYLVGAHSAGMYMRKAELEVNLSQGAFINIEDGKFWYNEPARNSGRGLSMNIGATYKKMKKEVSNYVPHSVYGNCKVADYKYKVGFSLLDLGAINFNQQVIVRGFDEDTPVDSMYKWTEITEEALSESEADKFYAWLPLGGSIQVDYNLENNLYFNFFFLNRIDMPSIRGAERSNVMSASVRYERKKFMASLPVSLHAYQYPQVGLGLRLWFFMIGTDNILNFIRRSDLYQGDLYFYFKIPIFKHPKCRFHKTKDKKGRGHFRKYMCPAW